MVLRTILSWGWSPIVITALAILGYRYQWPIEILAPVLVLILIIGMVLAVLGAREKELQLALLRLRQLAGYFNRRFMGKSSLSIFSVIDTLYALDNSQIWDWARACGMTQRVFDAWCESFIVRVESDLRTRRFDVYRRAYLNELWLMSTHYYEFIEQFYELAQKVQMPQETVQQYNRFVMEYNGFVQNFRDNIVEMNKTAKTEIEPPSVKLAKELAMVK
jgi:hypothetical protein